MGAHAPTFPLLAPAVRRAGAVTVRSTSEEARLVQRARSGDADAFTALVMRYQDRLWGFLASWVPEPADREEIAQEVFLAAFEGIGRFRGDARFSTWLFQIAVNQARGYRRRAARAPRAVELESTADRELSAASAVVAGEPPAPEAVAAHSQTRDRLWERVGELPESWQAALRLRYVEGMTHPEIATALDVPVGTVKVHLHRARKQLAAVVEREGWS